MGCYPTQLTLSRLNEGISAVAMCGECERCFLATCRDLSDPLMLEEHIGRSWAGFVFCPCGLFISPWLEEAASA